jgi:GrpB-like predicted nucleotidyltransferase (UPF0157 family)
MFADGAPKVVSVVVVEAQAAWAEDFGVLRARLWPVVRSGAIAIEHVGSTAVPGLAAKPIIDIDVVVADRAGLEHCIALLATAGYEHQGELGIPGRHAFKRLPVADGPPLPRHNLYVCLDADGPPLPRHNLYVCLDGALSLRNHLALRDWLRAHPEDVQAYAQLKRELAARFPCDIGSYVEGKTALITSILQRAGAVSDAEAQQLERQNEVLSRQLRHINAAKST